MAKNTNSLTHEEATKVLWDAQEIIYKALKALTGNPACNEIIRTLWSNAEHITNALKWIRNLRVGSYYKVIDYDKNYYIVRIEKFVPTDYSIECYCRLLTNTKDTVDYNIKNNDYITVTTAAIEGKEFDLVPEDLPLFVPNVFNGTLLKELLK